MAMCRSAATEDDNHRSSDININDPTQELAPSQPTIIDACCTPPAVDASCWLKASDDDALTAIQAAVGCEGAELVTVKSGMWILNETLHLNASNQKVKPLTA